MENLWQCLMRVNSRENDERFLHAGFPVLIRDETRSVEDTLAEARPGPWA